MWKLWPKAWTAGRNAADRRNAAATEALHARWRGRLATGLTRVLSREISEDEAPICLDALSGEQLLALDLALRQRQWSGTSLDPRSPANAAPELWQDSEAAARFLFVAACDANGHIRQEALRQFRVYAGRLALSAALIRCTDWVPEVQAMAESLLDSLLETLPATALLDELDLLISLRRRQRLRSVVWEERILPKLSAPESSEHRWRWVSEGPWRVRLFALQLVRTLDPARRANAMRQAITSSELPVALWAISALTELDPQLRVELLPLAARHPAAPVRAVGLRESRPLDPAIARPLLTTAIFDSARAPRTVAAKELELRFGERVLEHWRTALTEPGSRRWKGAFFGVCDGPEAEDIPRIASASGHPSAAVRTAVLRGLLRAHAPILGELLKRALFDKSKVVVSQAIEIFGGNDFTLERDDLETAIHLSTESTQRALIRATKLPGKWVGLDVLLQLAGDDSTRYEASQEIELWIASSNRRFTSPTPALLLRIRDQIAALGAALPPGLSASLLNITRTTRDDC